MDGLELCQFLKIGNYELRLFLPVPEMRNCELENDSFSIPLLPILVPIPPKCAKNGQGIGIAILLRIGIDPPLVLVRFL